MSLQRSTSDLLGEDTVEQRHLNPAKRQKHLIGQELLTSNADYPATPPYPTDDPIASSQKTEQASGKEAIELPSDTGT